MFLFLSNFILPNKKEFTCNLVNTLLTNRTVQDKIGLDKQKYSIIRIVNLTKKMSNCTCNQKFGYAAVIDEIPLDYNSGANIDFAVVEVNKKKEEVFVKVVAIQTGSTPCRWVGEIKFINDKSDFVIEDVEFYLVS